MHAELEALPGHGRAHLGRAAQQHLGRLERLLGQDGDRAGLDDAGLLAGDLLDRVAQIARCGRWQTGVTTATAPSTMLVASQVPPRPTSTTATSTGASANAANAIAVSTSKNDSRTGSRSSTSATYGADVLVGGEERLQRQRLAVDDDPLPDVDSGAGW